MSASTRSFASGETVGNLLKQERLLRAVSLEEVAQTTRIPLRTLRLMEADAFDQLPGEVFVRGFIKSYAKTLGLDDDAMVERFLRRHESNHPQPAVLSTMNATQERGRRFGAAIALVVLLILFTLALSIVLQPRHRSAPVELSRSTTLAPPATRLDAPEAAIRARWVRTGRTLRNDG